MPKAPLTALMDGNASCAATLLMLSLQPIGKGIRNRDAMSRDCKGTSIVPSNEDRAGHSDFTEKWVLVCTVMGPGKEARAQHTKSRLLVRDQSISRSGVLLWGSRGGRDDLHVLRGLPKARSPRLAYVRCLP